MADGYKVGNLEIAFEAVDKTSASFKDLAKNLKAISALINNISNADIGKFANNIKSITDSLSPFLTNINEANESLTVFASVTKQLGIKNISKASQNFGNITKSAEEATNGTQEFNAKVGEGTPTLEKVTSALKDVNKQLNKTKDSGTKGASGFKKFLKSIGRIAFYRLIRSAIKAITSSLTETAKAFAQVDDGVNDTMSQLTSSLQIIKLSFGATFLPILQMITPIVMDIGIAFAELANMVSQAMSTTGKYTKINIEAIKNYREELEKTGSLLDFDKFRVLNKQGGGLSDFLIPNQEVDESNEKIKNLRETLDKVKTVLSEVWSIVKPIGKFLVEHLDLVLLAIGAIVAVKIGSKIAGVIKDVQSLGSVLSLLAAHPIIAVIAAVAAMLVYLYATNEDFRESVNNLFNTLSPLVSLLSEFLSTFLQLRLKALEPLINDVIAPLATYLIKTINLQLSATMLQLTPFMFALEFILKILQTISNVIDALFSKDFSKLSSIGDLWKNWSSVGFAKSAWSSYKGSTKDILFSPFGTNTTNTGSVKADSQVVSIAPTVSGAVTNATVSSNTALSSNTLKNAFYQALTEWSKGNNNDMNVTVNLDSTQIYRSTNKRAQQFGQSWK